MAQVWNVERRWELAAGYALQNLDEDEMAVFQRWWREHPDLTHEVEALQEVVGDLAAQTPAVEPPPNLKNRLFQRLQATATPAQVGEVQERKLVPPIASLAGARQRRSPRIRGGWVAGIAAGMAIALGINTLLLTEQLQVATAQIQEQAALISQLQAQRSPAEPPLVLASSSDLVQADWYSIEHLFHDHTTSMQMENYKIMVPSAQPAEIAQALQDEVLMPDQLLEMVSETAQLMGGNACYFDQAEGARFVYQVGDTMVSFYQITNADTMGLAIAEGAPLYVTRPGGENAVIWQDGEFLYAILGDVAPDRLQQLSAATRQI